MRHGKSGATWKGDQPAIDSSLTERAKQEGENVEDRPSWRRWCLLGVGAREEGWKGAFGDVFRASTAVESASNVMEQGEGRELGRCLKGGSNVWEIMATLATFVGLVLDRTE